MSEYYEPGTGDKDSRDYIRLRAEDRLRGDIANLQELSAFDKPIGAFEQHTKVFINCVGGDFDLQIMTSWFLYGLGFRVVICCYGEVYLALGSNMSLVLLVGGWCTSILCYSKLYTTHTHIYCVIRELVELY